MSTKRIRTLFEKALVDVSTANSWISYYDNYSSDEDAPVDSVYITSHLIPAPTMDNSLSGDVITYLGVFQLNVNGVWGDGSYDVQDVIEILQETFQLNRVFTDEDKFTVQIISPLSTPEGTRNGVRWTIPCYFSYRADTNTTLTKR